MEIDRDGLEVLTRWECLRLLQPGGIGRIVVTDKALPAAFPVHFSLLDDDVVFLAAEGSKLDATESGEVVAFEVDEIDRELQAGWTVLIQGRASLVSDARGLARARAVLSNTWAPRGLTHVVRTIQFLGVAACPRCGSDELAPVGSGSP